MQLGAELASAGREGAEKVVRGRVGGEEKQWRAEEVLVAAGRTPNIESLSLESVGIKRGPRGIVVDDKLRTGAAWVYAAGDCAGRYLFTHSAAAEAVTALRNMFFPGSATALAVVPWTTFADPELAVTVPPTAPSSTRPWRSAGRRATPMGSPPSTRG